MLYFFVTYTLTHVKSKEKLMSLKRTMLIAVNRKGIIGNKDFLPWECKEDLKWFKDYTEYKVLVMGRITAKEIMKRGGLPNRYIHVASRRKFSVKGLRGQGGHIRIDLEELLNKNNEKVVPIKFQELYDDKEIIIAGGKSIYEYCLENDLVDEVYYSLIDDESEGDTSFLSLQEMCERYGMKVANTELKEGFTLFHCIKVR